MSKPKPVIAKRNGRWVVVREAPPPPPSVWIPWTFNDAALAWCRQANNQNPIPSRGTPAEQGGK